MQKTLEENRKKAEEIAAEVNRCGGRVFYVGGYVRDTLRGIETKDIDIEVHGIALSKLEEILNAFGKQLQMGESFGIFKLAHYDLDIALPRSEKAIGKGHKDFAISVNPDIGTCQAAKRRDFTINALMQDVLTGEILDYFGGRKDLQEGIIRHVDEETFAEDPLRVLRAAQFSARFQYKIAQETIELCKTMDLSTLSRERILGETEKAFLFAQNPSVYFEALRKMNHLNYWFKEVKDLIDIPQNPVYHAEGDVYRHTMMVLDEAGRYRFLVRNPRYFMMAALVHDFGKTVTTTVDDGRIRSIGHEREGLPLVRNFIERLTNEKELLQYCLNMTKLHMLPNQKVKCNASQKSFNHLFDEAKEPLDLIYLAIADNDGRITENKAETKAILLDKYAIYRETVAKPYVNGETLIQMGYVPSKYFKSVLEYAHKLRLANVPYESQLKQVCAYADKVLVRKKEE